YANAPHPRKDLDMRKTHAGCRSATRSSSASVRSRRLTDPRFSVTVAAFPSDFPNKETGMKKLIAAALSLAVTGLVVAADAPAKPAAPAPKKEAPAAAKSKLMDPASLNEKAPDTFKVKFDTSKGSFTVAVTREWSPLGADRFYNLVKNGWFDNERFFRVVPGFVVQFGMSGDPALNQAWQGATIQDDPVKQSNKRGFVVFAKTNAPNSRGTQFF